MGKPRGSASIKTVTPQRILPIEIEAMPLNELTRLTGNFASKALIGEGSYGRLYHTKLKNGQAVAIKKLDTSSSSEPDSDFTAQLAAVPALCVQYEADFRPNMAIVVKALQPLLNSRPAETDAHA